MTETISITALSPAELPPANKAIKAVVSLLWPYSSSTKQCALLLADPDFRLRNRKGQVRVRFTGPSAGAVAKAKVGIGDEVVLELRGAAWAGDAGIVLTPGKSVDGELVYRGELRLQVVKKASGDETDTTIAVNETIPPPEAFEQDGLRGRQNGFMSQTPDPATPSYVRRTLSGVDVVPIYSSPAFVKRLRLSGEKSSWDPFADAEWEGEQQPRKKQKVSFGNIASWKVAQRTPSPEKAARITQAEDGDDEVDFAPIANGLSHATASDPHVLPESSAASDPSHSGVVDLQSTMLPPSLPRLQMPGETRVETQQASGQRDGPSTPKLQPVPSSALPLPSPFPVENAQMQSNRSEMNFSQPAPLVQQTSESFVEVPVSGREAELIERSGHTPLGASHSEPAPLVVHEELAIQKIPEPHHRAPMSFTESLASTTEVIPDEQEEPAEPARGERIIRARDMEGHYSEHFTQEQIDAKGSDTEEDEEMYYEHMRRRRPAFNEDAQARVDPQAEGHYDDISEVAEDDIEEVVKDMGEPLEDDGDDSEDADGDEDEDSEVQVVETISIVDSDDDAGESKSAHQIEYADEAGHGSGSRHVHALEPSSARDGQELKTTLDNEGDKVLEASRKSLDNDSPGALEQSAAEGTAETVPQSREVTQAAGRDAVAQPANPSPETPARVDEPPAGLFGLDGTVNTPASKSTSRSDKDRIMAKTYSSLFGFKASPSPELPRQALQLQTPTPASAEGTNVPTVSRVERERFEAASARPTNPSTEPSKAPVDASGPGSRWYFQSRTLPDNSTGGDETSQTAGAVNLDTDKPTDVADIGDGSLLETIRKDETDVEAVGETESLPSPSQFVATDHITGEARMSESPSAEGSSTVIEKDRKLAPGSFQAGQDITVTRTPPATTALPADALPDGVAINEEMGAAIANSADLEAPESSAPLSSQQIEVIDLGSSDDEEGEVEQTQRPAQQLLAPDDGTVDAGHPDFSLFQVPPYHNTTETSQGSALQSDMLDTTQTTVDRSEVQTPIEHDEDMTIPETVPDEPAPWTGPGQESFFAEHTQHQQELAEEPGIPLTQQTNNTIGDYHFFSFQSATSVATDNSENSLPPTAQPSFARDEGEDEEESMAQAESPEAELPASQPPLDGATHSGNAKRLLSSPGLENSDDAETANEESRALQEAALDLARPQVDTVQSLMATSAAHSFSQFAQRQEDFAMASSSFQSAHSPEQARTTEPAVDEPRDSQPEAKEAQRSSRQSLPPSPEASQDRLASQPFETQINPLGVLPPTPQLTQGDSLTAMVDEGAEDVKATVEPISSRKSLRNRDVISGGNEQGQAKDAAVRRSPRKHAQQSQESHPTETLSTPPHTRSQGPVEDETMLSPEKIASTRRSSRKSRTDTDDLHESEQRSQGPRTRRATRTATPEPEPDRKLLSPEARMPVRRSPRKNKAGSQNLDGDTENQANADGPDGLAASSRRPSRKSFRLSAVPEAISNWFSPKHSPQSKAEEQEPEVDAPGEPEQTAMRRHRRSTGFSTDLAYFLPLSNLNEKLNSSEKVDVLAVVTDGTKAPERAKSGQRDYYTIFHITDPSLEKDESIRVEVYRPWHANLPVAQVGDVVLLRAFSVKSRKRQTYLFSADTSAWCAWRYAESEEDNEKPAWARRKRAVSFSGMKEEFKGPPVELGDEERGHAAELRAWWQKVNLSAGSPPAPGSAEKRRRSEKL